MVTNILKVRFTTVFDLKEGDWIECQGMFSLIAKVTRVFSDSFDGEFFFQHLDGKNYTYLGNCRYHKKIIARKLNGAKRKELEEMINANN